MANESEARGGADRLDRAAVMIEARRQYQIVGLARHSSYARFVAVDPVSVAMA
jgi:hypothetical protein